MSEINKKHLFSKILVAIDGSVIALRAADSAISIAKQQNLSNIILIHVLPQDIRYDDLTDRVDPEIPSPVKGAVELASLEAQEWFNKIKERQTDDAKKIDIRTEVLVGTKSVAKEILTYAENNNVDLIVIGTKGMSTFKKVLLGSVASSVLTHAFCPVMIVK
ncbi:MAG TPA: universal stress protein [Nitrososphaeraceae archaeon]|jgi:nucleotide-binding universal stress UspA family protein